MKPMLAKALETEVAEWNRKQYAELAALDYPITYERGTIGEATWYQVEVDLLEKNEQYIQFGVSVDDGGISAFCPRRGSTRTRGRSFRLASKQRRVVALRLDGFCANRGRTGSR